MESKKWFSSKRFWLGTATLVSGCSGVCNLLSRGNVTVSAIAIGLGAVSAALRIWLGQRDADVQVNYGRAGVVMDPLQRIEAARGATARWAQFKAEARRLADALNHKQK